MMIVATIFAFVLLTLASARDSSLIEVRRAFEQAHIPGNLSLAFNPSVILDVTFPEAGERPITLTAGIQLPRNATAGPPRFSLGERSVDKGPFVVATVDLDAPTPQSPTLAQIRHFLGGNFVLDDPRDPLLLTNTTPAISQFRQPTPPAGSDPHRYVFLLFRQPRGFNQQSFVTPATPITNFNISAFSAEVGLGEPIGGTFMLVGPEPST